MISQLLKYICRLFTSSEKGQHTEIPLPSKKLYKKFYSYTSMDEFPETVKANVIYHVGEKEFKWVAVLKCPCGCGDTIQLNLLKDSSPCWRVKIHSNGDISLYPSVNRTINCKSHFNITKNNVRWWEDWLSKNY